MADIAAPQITEGDYATQAEDEWRQASAFSWRLTDTDTGILRQAPSREYASHGQPSHDSHD